MRPRPRVQPGPMVVKMLPIKIPPPKAFEGDRDYERVATWLREVENFFRAMAVEENQKVQTAAGLLGGDALTWWAEYIKDQEIVESEMFLDGIQDSCHEPVYPRVREHSCGSGVVGFEANTFDQSLRGEVPRGCEYPPTCVGLQ